MKPHEELAREEEAPHDSDKSSRAGMLWLAIVGLPLAYLLSIGPVLRYSHRGSEVVRGFYAPVVWLAQESLPFRNCINSYLEKVWGVH